MMVETVTYHHVPVMLEETLAMMRPRSGGLYCDGTAGRGGHSRALLEASKPDGRLLALDRDPEAVKFLKKELSSFGDRVQVMHSKFSDLPEILEREGLGKLDGLLVDLGVSSVQLDDPHRGLSFQKQGPIDMRLDRSVGKSALDLIVGLKEEELARIIYEYGEERRSRRIAKALKTAHKQGELATTLDLAHVVRRAVGKAKSGRIDSATRTFQALRIAVNEELSEVEALVEALPKLLNSGGRAALISFHSLEDRAVKHGLRRWSSCRCAKRVLRCECGGALMRVLTKKPVEPKEKETKKNPRSRSAKLRVAERLPSSDFAEFQ